MHLHRAPFVRATALAFGFATAWACGSPSTEDSGTFEGEARFPGAMEIPPVVITDGIFNVVRTADER